MDVWICIFLFVISAFGINGQSNDIDQSSSVYKDELSEANSHVLTNVTQTSFNIEIHEKCSQYAVKGDIYINCSGAGLDHIPKLPVESFSVDFSRNKIENLTAYQFAHLQKLNFLDLSDNPLANIDQKAFNGLSEMETLLIRRSNLLKLDINDVDHMISSLSSLTHFALTLRQISLKYMIYCRCPDVTSDKKHPIVPYITSVNTLEIDSMFFKEILNSTTSKWKTKHLDVYVSENCYYKLLSKTCFQNIRSLEELSVSFHYRKEISLLPPVSFSYNSFDNNDNLSSLKIQSLLEIIDLKKNSDSFNMTAHFRNITTSVSKLGMFKSLSIQRVYYGYDPNFSFADALSPLKISKSIESLDISNNGLTGINEIKDRVPLPKSLKRITANDNCLSFLFLWWKLNYWSLDSFAAKEQNHCLGQGQSNKSLQDTRLPIKGSLANGVEHLIYTHSDYRVDLYELNILTKVRNMDLSWNSNKLNTKTFKGAFFERLTELEYLDLTGYTIENIEANATNHKKLKYFNLTSNSLWKMGCTLSERFTSLPSLIDLRLSDNRISYLSKDTFAGLKSVEVIDLSRNNLETFETSLKHLTNLQSLNLSNNNIRTLTKSTMDELDNLPEVSVDLGQNKLTCNCVSIPFLKWLQKEKKRFVKLEEYICSLNNNSFVYLSSLEQITKELDRSCVSYTVTIVICCLLLAFLTAVIVGVIIYRYRWKLRYLYYMTKLQIQNSGGRVDYEQMFDFDAFISYASDDFEVARTSAMEYLEQQKAFRLCIHERDFQPGESIPFNICRGIQQSKRTFLFFSRSFVQSRWCQYELNIAQMESLSKNRNFILVIILENIPSNEMTLEMLNCVKNSTYLEYPQNGNQEDLDVFWGKCADFINGH